MRLTILLPLCCAVVVPAHAQTGISGIHFGLPMSSAQPVSGYAPDSFYSPNNGPFRDMQRAQSLIAAGDYAQADRLLATLFGRTNSRQVRFLKGVAKLGLGDAEAARRFFEMSLYRGRNGAPGAMSGLALAEIRLGNRDAAHSILDKLRYQRERCGSSFDRATSLDRAVNLVERALA